MLGGSRGVIRLAGALGCALVLLPAAAGADDGSSCPGASRPLRELSPAQERSAMRCLVAQRRDERGLTPVRRSSPLRRLALELARDLVVSGGRGHISSSGEDLPARARRHLGPSFHRRYEVGEVVAFSSGRDTTPAELFGGLVGSRPHRRILDDRRYVLADAGVATHGDQAVAVVELALNR